MTNTAILKALAGIKEDISESVFWRAVVSIEEIMEFLKQDIAVKSVKPSEKTTYKAVLRFAKECAKNDIKPSLAGAFTCPETGYQTVCDGYRLWQTTEPLAALPEAPKNLDCLKTSRLVSEPRASDGVYNLPALADLKTARAKSKAEYTGKPSRFTHITKLASGLFVNTKYLIECMEMLGEPIWYRNDGNILHALYMESKDSKSWCILLPVRPSPETEETAHVA